MGNDKIGLVGLAVALLIVALYIGSSNVEPAFVKGAFVVGCLLGAIVSVVIVVKGE